MIGDFTNEERIEPQRLLALQTISEFTENEDAGKEKSLGRAVICEVTLLCALLDIKEKEQT